MRAIEYVAVLICYPFGLFFWIWDGQMATSNHDYVVRPHRFNA